MNGYTEFLCLPISTDILSQVEELLGYYQSRVSVRQTITYGNANGQFKYFGFYKALFDFLIAPPPVAPNLIFLGQNMKTGKHQVAFVFDGGFEKVVDLTPKEYELLFYLVDNKNIALSRDKLLSDIWGYDFYGDDRTIDTHIKNLRNNLGKYRDYIVTLRGVGYKFEA